MKQFIKDNRPYSQTDREDLVNHYLSLGCEEVDVLYVENFINPLWNGTEWVESATSEEIIESNKPIVPENISAMRLKLQLFDLGITDQDIFDSIDSIPDNIFSLPDKEKAKIKYKTSTIFDRNNEELNLVATMKGLSQEDLDNIFINGNNN
jgi:hypothetical protein